MEILFLTHLEFRKKLNDSYRKILKEKATNGVIEIENKEVVEQEKNYKKNLKQH